MSYDLVERAHAIMENLPNSEKKEMLKCIDNYRRIIKKNYHDEEDVLYQKYSVYNLTNKIYFELNRINKYLSNNSSKLIINENIMKKLDFITKNIELLGKMQTDFSRSQKEKQIINDIIEFELFLNMQITLYIEFIDYFKDKIDEYGISYQKKRD